jgi:hypothetical protein
MNWCKSAGMGGFAAMAVLGAGGPASARPAAFALSSEQAPPADSAWLVVAASVRGQAPAHGSTGGDTPFRPTFGQGGYPSPPAVLRDMPTSQQDRGVQTPTVARYSVGDGAAFVLDRSSETALLKFEDNPEVWVLQPSLAPRGDVIYKNDLGEPVLRVTRLGGLTLFSPAAPAGAAAAMVGGADDLQPPSVMSPNVVFQRLLEASIRASRAAQHLIKFDAADVTPDSAPIYADAATAAAEAVIALSRRDDGRTFLRRLDRMSFLAGPRPGAVVKPGVMQVIIDAADGMAGHPSSGRLVRAALGK